MGIKIHDSGSAGGVADTGVAPVFPIVDAVPTDADFDGDTVPDGTVVIYDSGTTMTLYAKSLAGVWENVSTPA